MSLQVSFVLELLGALIARERPFDIGMSVDHMALQITLIKQDEIAFRTLYRFTTMNSRFVFASVSAALEFLSAELACF